MAPSPAMSASGASDRSSSTASLSGMDAVYSGSSSGADWLPVVVEEIQPIDPVEFKLSCARIRRETPKSSNFRERYVLDTQKSMGKSSVIHRARDVYFDREVAVKSIQEAFLSDAGVEKQFLREACLNARLDHPCIPSIYGLERDEDGQWHLVMKLIEGESLRHFVEHKRSLQEGGIFSIRVLRNWWVTCLEIFGHLCDVVSYCHHTGVSHNHIGLDTILLSNSGVISLMDWSEARLLPQLPEKGYEADLRALRNLLFRMLTMDTETEDIDHPPFLLDRKLLGILKKSDPDQPDAYPSVEMLLQDILHYLRNEEVSAYPDHFGRKLSRFFRKYKVVIFLAMIFAALATGVMFVRGMNADGSKVQKRQMLQLQTLRFQADTRIVARATDVQYMRMFYKFQLYINDLAKITLEPGSRREHKYDNADFASERGRPEDFGMTPLYPDKVSLSNGVMLRRGAQVKSLASTAEFARICQKVLFQSIDAASEGGAAKTQLFERLMVEWQDGTRYSFPGRLELDKVPNAAQRWPEVPNHAGMTKPYEENGRWLATFFKPVHAGGQPLAKAGMEIRMDEVNRSLILASSQNLQREYFIIDPAQNVTLFYQGSSRPLERRSRFGMSEGDFKTVRDTVSGSSQRLFSMALNQKSHIVCAIPLEYYQSAIVGQIIDQQQLNAQESF